MSNKLINTCKFNVLGIDIGSVSISIVQITSMKKIEQTESAFHHGDISKKLKTMLQGFNLENISYVATTSSTPITVHADKVFDDQVSIITAVKHFHKNVGSLLLVGGEKFSLTIFDKNGNYKSYKTNTSCAAGTGSFLDQQSGRLNLENIQQLSKIAYNNTEKIPKIASRCAVFAKTDLIHAQQEGYKLAGISDGLCFGLAKNIVDTLFSGEKALEPVIFCGGVSKNKAVVEHLNNLLDSKLIVDVNSHLYGAIGAAFSFIDLLLSRKENIYNILDNNKKHLTISNIIKEDIYIKSLFYPKLELKLSSYPDFKSFEKYNYSPNTNINANTKGKIKIETVEVDIYENINNQKKIKAFLGIDIGSTSTKAVLVGLSKNIIAGFYTRTSGNPLKALQNIYDAIDNFYIKKNIALKIVGCSSTGSGRNFIGKITGADLILNEITAHARAACELNFNVDTIIEIGGQDSKFTTLKNGMVTSSTMNNVCAAGTGSFIEEQALKLGCNINDYSKRCENVEAPMASDRCTVFMERDINHYLIEGYTIEQVLASALHSVRENYLLKVASEAMIGDIIFFQGATAKNKALVAAFEQKLQKPIIVSKYCHLTGAIGAALSLLDERDTKTCQDITKFRGIGIYKKEIPIKSEVCTLCTNSCKITIANVNGTNVAYGFLCGRDYEHKKYVNPNPALFNLVKERKKIFPFNPVNQYREQFIIGIPSAMYLLEELPLWKKFFELLSIKTIVSDKFMDGVKLGKNLSGAEFCAPVSEMHGHVAYLIKKADYIFLPFYLENKQKQKNIRRQYCYYTQFIPSLVSSVISPKEEDKFLNPLLKYRQTEFSVKIQLYKMFKKITTNSIGFLEISSAYDGAVSFMEEGKIKLKELYNKTSISNNTNNKINNDINVIFLGRPYTVLSPSLNNKIPEIFASLDIKTYFQDMLYCSDIDIEPIVPLLDEIHWYYASQILKTAETVAKIKGLYPVFITSFKCSPDSFVTQYFKTIMESYNKPYLILELDEHDSNVGYETRIEAAVRAFRNHQHTNEKILKNDIEKTNILKKLPINPEIEKKITGKNIVIPNWDNITCNFLVAILQGEGYNAVLMEETEMSIQQSLKHNTGQCIPLNAVAQGYMECIKNNNLSPADTVLWLGNSDLACNIKLYPHHIKTILNSYGNGLEKAGVYKGEISFFDISMRTAINSYFAFMFGGLLRKIGCKIRPYEVEKGETDKVIRKSIEILSDAFRGKFSRKEALADVISRFKWIETKNEYRPKVAIFGDLYVRDNDVMNQNLIHFIEEHGGEVITTPYSEYAKMIAGTYFKKWFNEGKYLHLISSKAILTTMTKLEKIYYRYFGRILGDINFDYATPPEDILSQYNIASQNTGESMDNILKIYHIKNHYPDVELFVQTSPGLCCASLITEAMIKNIEEKTGVPVVCITYDGTCGNKNQAIIPYLKFTRDRVLKIGGRNEPK